MSEKQKLLLIAYRAIGDTVFMCPLIPYLTEKYDVYLDCSTKAWLLLHDDPRFKRITRYSEYEGRPREEYAELFAKRWAKLREEIKPDLEINLNGTLEVKCIAENFQDEFYLPVGERRGVFGKHGFLSSTFEAAGLPFTKDISLEGMYFWEDQTTNCEQWKAKHKDQFVVVIPIAGSTAQKIFHNFKEVATQILNKYEDAVVYLAGDEPCRQHVFEHPRVKIMIGADVSIKQAVQRMKYADLVIGPETFLLAAAGMFGTPKVCLATTTSIFQLTELHKNDFSIQAPIACSPCHRAIYFEDDCESPMVTEEGKFIAASCSKMFSTADIMQRVDWVYRDWKEKFMPSAVGLDSGPHLPVVQSDMRGGSAI